jgi:hypothetical protein
MPRLKPAGPRSKDDRPKFQRAEQALFKRRGKASTIKNAAKIKRTTVKRKPKAAAKAVRDAESSRIKKVKSNRQPRFRTA